ncbi:MAG: hypothetical protein M0Z50_12855 [Planctomycetia bacterium]|nr:hypothetical protein [Planctomycetia bacterium]
MLSSFHHLLNVTDDVIRFIFIAQHHDYKGKRYRVQDSVNMDGQHTVTLRASPCAPSTPASASPPPPLPGASLEMAAWEQALASRPATRVRAWRRSLLVLAASHARH